MVKLGYYDIRGTTQRWIRSFLTDRTQQVLVEGATSGSIPVVTGVPQGTVLGLLLFLLLINDLLDCVLSRTRFFTDDCNLFKSQQDCGILQDDLYQLATQEKKWDMASHPNKTASGCLGLGSQSRGITN